MFREEAKGVAGFGRSRECVRCLLGTFIDPPCCSEGQCEWQVTRGQAGPPLYRKATTILDLRESQAQPCSLGYESRPRSMAPRWSGGEYQSAPSFASRLCCPLEWGEILVRTALVATGLVDETPNIAGMNPAEVHSGRVRSARSAMGMRRRTDASACMAVRTRQRRKRCF